MPQTTVSSREFNQDTSSAKRAARKGPVFITDRGRPAHVLLTIEEYDALTHKQPTLVDLLTPAEPDTIEFDPPRVDFGPFREVDLS